MEYIYIPQPKKEKEAYEEERCKEATDDEWAKYMYRRGYFLSPRHAIEFLECHKPLTKINTDNVFKDVSIKLDDS